MFIFKQGSRYAMNKDRAEHQFSKNYEKIFKLPLPHMDTINNVMVELKKEELEHLKFELISSLIEKKVLSKFKLLDSHYMIAVDGTGVQSFEERHCEKCLVKKTNRFELSQKNFQSLTRLLGDSKQAIKPLIGQRFRSGKSLLSAMKAALGGSVIDAHEEVILTQCNTGCTERYFHNVLEAKLIGKNGFSLSIGTQWIENASEQYDKQDCELKAFSRLSADIKQRFPRLAICIIADGLYPNETAFELCRKNQWEFIFTFKKGSLKTIRQEINDLLPLNKANTITERVIHRKSDITREYHHLNRLNYNEHFLSWVRCFETIVDKNGNVSKINFEYLSSIYVDVQIMKKVVDAGRLRQKIENEGFNIQKNHGYNLKHKYSRKSLLATKNYYQCLQIAHLINQLLLLSCQMKNKISEWRCSIKQCWKLLMGLLIFVDLDLQTLEEYCEKKTQYRYAE